MKGMNDYPKDMPEEIRKQLWDDEFIFGNSFWEKENKKYRRICPMDVVCKFDKKGKFKNWEKKND